jgi:hypothetical protein
MRDREVRHGTPPDHAFVDLEASTQRQLDIVSVYQSDPDTSQRLADRQHPSGRDTAGSIPGLLSPGVAEVQQYEMRGLDVTEVNTPGLIDEQPAPLRSFIRKLERQTS